MKKILPFLMILMVLFAFVACDNGNGGNGGGDGDSGGTGSAGGSGSGGGNTGGGENLPEAVGTDEFAGTTWKWTFSNEESTSTETYMFGTDGTVKFIDEYTNTTNPEENESYYTTYYYSYDSNKKILTLQIKSIDFFGVGKQLSSFPTSEEMYEICIEMVGGEDELKAELAAMGMTWEEFYESEAMYEKEYFEEMMKNIEYIPYEKISDNEATFYRDFYGDNIDMQTYLDEGHLSYQATNAEGISKYGIESYENDDDSSYLVLTLYEEDESGSLYLTEIRTTKIEGNTLTWKDDSTSTCTVTWNNTEKCYDFVIKYGGDDYPAYQELSYTTYTKQ